MTSAQRNIVRTFSKCAHSVAMSGFGTKKPGGDLGVQLTFPGVFSRAYKQLKLGERYAPSLIAPAKQEYVGADFQAMEHQRRRDEAHHMVRAAVYATQESRRRAFSSHCGYYGLPEPVLTQRVRGSNFGVGVGGGMGYPSPFAGAVGAGLEGGVIGSREGRVYVKDALSRRKAQLDAIDANELEGPTIQAQVEARAPNDFSELSKIELISYLDQLQAQIVENNIQLSPDTFRKFLSLLVRFAVVADERELEQITVKVADVQNDLESEEEMEEDGSQNPSAARSKLQQYKELLFGYFEKVYAYLAQMFRGLSMSPQDRKTLSKSLLKSLKFGEMSGEMVDWARQFGKIPTFTGPRFRPHGGDDDMPGDDDEGGDEGEGSMVASLGSAGVSRGTGARSQAAEGMFSRQPLSAELSGGPRVQLSRDVLRMPDVRDRFGRQGMYGELRPARAYAREEMGPGAQEEGDFEGDALEAAAAASAAMFPGGDDSGYAALERLRREQEAEAYGDFTSAAAVPEGESQEDESAAAAVPRGSVEALRGMSPEDFWSEWPIEGAIPPVLSAIKEDIVRKGGLDRWVGQPGFEGKAGVPKLQKIINQIRARAGLAPTSSTTPKYLRSLLKTTIKEYAPALR
jgi:hypothetical protein